ncbi:hypothetical protein PsorP6_001285 [Peronosclerospora sorghi]|uniref:Uncharacterized protein n=1 Tax=Peronosclerospora sorghi TaxID=230839 RepID=A0ACC0WX27_9STRA|nr:hypothetical protein PsorP6_001285 [Peronosclerospora sorghi]
MSLAGSPDASNSLRLRFAPGDVVLVLEFDIATLPATIKTVEPDDANHRGIVLTVEHTEPRTDGNQLLKVRMFADENLLVVPNHNALRVTNASDFSKPVDLLRLQAMHKKDFDGGVNSKNLLSRIIMTVLEMRHPVTFLLTPVYLAQDVKFPTTRTLQMLWPKLTGTYQ